MLALNLQCFDFDIAEVEFDSVLALFLAPLQGDVAIAEGPKIGPLGELAVRDQLTPGVVPQLIEIASPFWISLQVSVVCNDLKLIPLPRTEEACQDYLAACRWPDCRWRQVYGCNDFNGFTANQRLGPDFLPRHALCILQVANLRRRAQVSVPIGFL